MNKNELAVFKDLASIYRWQAEWNLNQNQEAADSIKHAMDAIGNASKLSTGDPETLAIHSTLKLLSAREAQDARRRRDLSKEAHELLSKALSANPFLKREYEGILKQAKSLN